MIDFIGKKWLFFAISGIVIIPGIISLLMWGLRLSIDFTGGTLLEIRNENFAQPQKLEAVKKIFINNGVQISTVTKSGINTYIFRTKEFNQQKNESIKKEIEKSFGQVEEKRFESVGPVIGKELTRKAIISIILASLMIILYVAWSFRQVPKPYSSFKFGVSAIVALLHDVLLVVGIFSLLGHFYRIEIDTLFVTALLTVIGFSVHDTIVVFDRIRENLKKMPGKKFSYVANESILETLVRSLSTGLTVIFTLSALLLFGGDTIRWFVVALLIGIVSGTYSSIFNATPLLVLWEEKK
ncbi:protein translocase subunit SecF [Candidatus Microgenomates bacterium]|nr:protein translocase subunit SecF [Candidatus Microgenomates bacterium]